MLSEDEIHDTQEGAASYVDTYEPEGDIDVMDPGTWQNDAGPPGWFAVGDDDGIFAYAVDFAHAVVIRDMARMRAKISGRLKGKSGANGNVENYLSGGVVR